MGGQSYSWRGGDSLNSLRCDHLTSVRISAYRHSEFLLIQCFNLFNHHAEWGKVEHCYSYWCYVVTPTCPFVNCHFVKCRFIKPLTKAPFTILWIRKKSVLIFNSGLFGENVYEVGWWNDTQPNVKLTKRHTTFVQLSFLVENKMVSLLKWSNLFQKMRVNFVTPWRLIYLT